MKQLYTVPTHHVFASNKISLEAQSCHLLQINNFWGAGGKDVWDGLATAIKAPVNCTGTTKDPLSRIPEDISRSTNVC